MALELKLHSPAGAESIVYTWPLQKSVSFSAGISVKFGILWPTQLITSVVFVIFS